MRPVSGLSGALKEVERAVTSVADSYPRLSAAPTYSCSDLHKWTYVYSYYAAPRLSAVMPERSSSLQDVLQVRAVRALAGRRAAQSRRGCSKETPDRPVAGRNSTAAAHVGCLVRRGRACGTDAH